VFVLITLGIATFATLGLVIASVTNTMQETQIINQIIWFAFLFLSGVTVPLPILPKLVQKVSYFLPATYLVSGLQQSMVDHAGISELGLDLASMLGCTVIAFLVSTQLFRWEPEAKAPRRAKLWAAAAIVPFLLLGIWENKYQHVLSRSISDYQLIEQSSPPDPKTPAR
jgi:hypothetical protein